MAGDPQISSSSSPQVAQHHNNIHNVSMANKHCTLPQHNTPIYIVVGHALFGHQVIAGGGASSCVN
jgi:hypothetical protein